MWKGGGHGGLLRDGVEYAHSWTMKRRWNPGCQRYNLVGKSGSRALGLVCGRAASRCKREGHGLPRAPLPRHVAAPQRSDWLQDCARAWSALHLATMEPRIVAHTRAAARRVFLAKTILVAMRAMMGFSLLGRSRWEFQAQRSHQGPECHGRNTRPSRRAPRHATPSGGGHQA